LQRGKSLSELAQTAKSSRQCGTWFNALECNLAERFIANVEAALESIGQYPRLSAEIEQDIRRKLTRVFPYALLYTIEPNRILVLAVMHCGQEPRYWHGRLVDS
jgi:toxin ParE1/3/4